MPAAQAPLRSGHQRTGRPPAALGLRLTVVATMNARTSGAAYDVIVVGGGMVGGLFACVLGDSGLKVAVLERQPAPTPDVLEPRVSAITPASRAMLEAVGAWAGVGARP